MLPGGPRSASRANARTSTSRPAPSHPAQGADRPHPQGPLPISVVPHGLSSGDPNPVTEYRVGRRDGVPLSRDSIPRSSSPIRGMPGNRLGRIFEAATRYAQNFRRHTVSARRLRPGAGRRSVCQRKSRYRRAAGGAAEARPLLRNRGRRPRPRHGVGRAPIPEARAGSRPTACPGRARGRRLAVTACAPRSAAAN